MKQIDSEPVSVKTPETSPPKLNQKNKVLWSLLFLIIAVLSIWAVTSYSHDFSFNQFWAYVKGANPLWLLCAFACMLGFIYFEGMGLRCLDKALGHPHSRLDGYFYSASDIYFSAITPGASGGQPACAYFMIRDGIPGAVATMALLANLTMYTVSMLIIGIVSFLLCPQVFFHFGTLSKVLVSVGFLVQIGLIALYTALQRDGRILHKIGRWGIHFLAKLHLLRHEERKIQKLDRVMEDYKNCSKILKNQKKLCVNALAYNILQRMSQVAVALFAYLATGGKLAELLGIWSVQGYAIIGACSIPIPGAMGVTDYLLLDGFQQILDQQQAVDLELLSRSFAFYFCIIICSISTLIKYFYQKRRRIT